MNTIRIGRAATGLAASCLIALAAPHAQAQWKTTGVKPGQVDSSATRAALVKPANDGAGFQLICRGGPGLRIGISGEYPASNGPTSWFLAATMTVDFNRSTQPPDPAGRNLQPGQCSPTRFALRDVDPAQVRDGIRAADPWHQSADAAESFPNTKTIPAYLKDSNHYWLFSASDTGDGYLLAANSSYWKPESYKGPAASASYASTGPVAAMGARAGTTTQATPSGISGLGVHTEGHAGAPAVPSPAAPAVPPVIDVPIVAPVASVMFSPPLLQNGEQLWTCVDAAAGQADAQGCSGEQSAQAYCRLRDAESVAGPSVANAQPGIPVRAVNGDVCPDADACRVVSELQCDH
ncbi:MAG: hypothetical protein ABJA62_03075 [Luteimonas sp.]